MQPTIKDLLLSLPDESVNRFEALSHDSKRKVLAKLNRLLKSQNKKLQPAVVNRFEIQEAETRINTVKPSSALATNNPFSVGSGMISSDVLRLEITSGRESTYQGMGCLCGTGLIASFMMDLAVFGLFAGIGLIYSIKKIITTDDFLLLDFNSKKILDCEVSSGNVVTKPKMDLSQLKIIAVESQRQQNKDNVWFQHRIVGVLQSGDTISLSDWKAKHFPEAIEYARVIAQRVEIPYFHGDDEGSIMMVLNTPSGVSVKYT
ncbi:MAG: hypothetical protein H3C47_11095 [Candidatus Cloacimonetes bacterium]|nr:hypothetical protein [Candidatus Cloacimonadota bacterium]